MYRDEQLEHGTLTYTHAGMMGVALSATRDDGENKIRFCESYDEVTYYQTILRDWLNGLDRDESKYTVTPWGVMYEPQYPFSVMEGE